MKKIVAIVSCIVLFISFLTLNIIVHKPLDEEQYQTLEQVVYDAYKNEDFLMEVPDGVHLKKSETKITADFSNLPDCISYGYVEGKIVNNEFTTIRVDEKIPTIFSVFGKSFLITVLCIFILGLAYFCIMVPLALVSDSDYDIFVDLTGVKNIKQLFNRFKYWFNLKRFFAILISIIFIIGSFAFCMYTERPFTEDEWEQAEILAEKIYNSNKSLMEIPENFNVSVDTYRILISDNSKWKDSPSVLEATVKDGKLTFVRAEGILNQILISIFCALAFPACLALLLVISALIFTEWIVPSIEDISKKIKKKRSNKRAEKIYKKIERNKLK